MRPFHATLLCLLLALPAQAQSTWGNLDQMLAGWLAPGQQVLGSFWLPDSADPATATTALGVVYPLIPGAAGNTGIEAGIFTRPADAWIMTTPVQGLFGQDPRDHAISADRIELTTTMLGPGEPRCCPTLPVRWVIDRATGAAQRLN